MSGDTRLRAKMLIAQAKMAGAGCCTSECIPESQVIEVLSTQIDQAHAALEEYQTRLYLAQKELRLVRASFEAAELSLRQARAILNDLGKEEG